MAEPIKQLRAVADAALLPRLFFLFFLTRHPRRPPKRRVGRFGWQFIALLLHVGDKLQHSRLRPTPGMDNAVVICLEDLASVIWNEVQVVVNAPAKK